MKAYSSLHVRIIWFTSLCNVYVQVEMEEEEEAEKEMVCTHVAKSIV